MSSPPKRLVMVFFSRSRGPRRANLHHIESAEIPSFITPSLLPFRATKKPGQTETISLYPGRKIFSLDFPPQKRGRLPHMAVCRRLQPALQAKSDSGKNLDQLRLAIWRSIFQLGWFTEPHLGYFTLSDTPMQALYTWSPPKMSAVQPRPHCALPDQPW